MAERIRVLIADDHTVLRDGLKALVNSQTDMAVVGEAANGRSAWQMAKDLRPDVVIMDISMPEFNGINATRALKQERPEIQVLALTAHKDKIYMDQLLQSGASGYVLKLSASNELIDAIRQVASGKVYIDRQMAERLTDLHAKQQNLKGLRGSVQQKPLTEREERVLRLIAQGYSNKEIAAELSISVKTVESHRANFMEKLELKSRTDIVRHALLQGWLQEDQT